MVCSAQNRNGAFIRDPSPDQMRALIASLAEHDQVHPDIALKHESEWCLSVFGSGLVVFENVESGEGPWHMRGVSQDRALELWLNLAAGKISDLKSLPWSIGYGYT